MSPAAGPGRTWLILPTQRRLPVLAGALSTALLHGGRRFARLSGLGGKPAFAVLAHMGGQGDSRCESSAEHSGH